MAYTLQDIRDLVRDHLDIETEDLPDTVLDKFIREGSEKIAQAEARWPFYEMSTTYTTEDGVSEVALADISTSLKRIVSMTIDSSPLEWISLETSAERFTSASTGTPTHYSEWGGNIIFFPTPNGGDTVTVRGYRSQTDWVTAGAGAEPDMDESLHMCVANWALYRAYAQQEDPELSHEYKQLFENEVNEIGRRMTELPMTRPFILNRGRGGYHQGYINPNNYNLDW